MKKKEEEKEEDREEGDAIMACGCNA